MIERFNLFAFYSDEKSMEELVDADIDGVIIDWERKGKAQRQLLYNTQINEHTLEELKIAYRKKPKHIICRINGPNYWTKNEVESAITFGADEVLLPMVSTPEDIELLMQQVDGRCSVSVMLETQDCLDMVDELHKYPLKRVFVGLNDLSIHQKTQNLFIPLVDGTIDRVRPFIKSDFGFAGLTHPTLGDPIPCTYLIHKMKEQNCTFGILRRSFYRDVPIFGFHKMIQDIRKAMKEKSILSSEMIAHYDQKILELSEVSASF